MIEKKKRQIRIGEAVDTGATVPAKSSDGISFTKRDTLLYCVSPRIIRERAQVTARFSFALVIPT